MEKILNWLPQRPQPILIRYAAAVVLTLLCAAAVYFVQEQTGVSAFFLMYPAIFLSALLFDRGSGFVATGLSTILLVVLLRKEDAFLPPDAFWVPLILFFAVGLGLAALSEILRKGWERAVAAERAKDLLYRELAHRTKNDFMLVSSLLGVQSRSQTNPAVKEALDTAIRRLHVLSKLHDQFQPVEGELVQMRTYLEGLCRSLDESMQGGSVKSLNLSCDEFELPAARAMPVGLIVNELVTNAYKHAFSETNEGVVTVTLRRAELCALIVEDDGKGCPETGGRGVGSRVVDLLVGQLDGVMNRTNTDRGCRVKIEFPERPGSA